MPTDSDLAALYGVSTGQFNQQIRRNLYRFPPDFAFRLTPSEFANLRSQIVISSLGWGGRRYPPLAFTEHGAVMAANVLNSPRAVAVSVEVVRAFVRLRKLTKAPPRLAGKLAELEKVVMAQLREHDAKIDDLFRTIARLMNEDDEDPPTKHIGFKP